MKRSEYIVELKLPLQAAAQLLKILAKSVPDEDLEDSRLKVQSMPTKRGEIERVEFCIRFCLMIDTLTTVLQEISKQIDIEDLETANLTIGTCYAVTDGMPGYQLRYFQKCNQFIFKSAQAKEEKKNNNSQTD